MMMTCTKCGKEDEYVKVRGRRCGECYRASHRKHGGRRFLDKPFEYLRTGYHIPLMTRDWRNLGQPR